MKPSVLKMLHEIEKKKSIYNIHYCGAGVGFIFYEGPEILPAEILPADWKRFLTVEKYYPTFENAVQEEWDKINRKRK